MGFERYGYLYKGFHGPRFSCWSVSNALQVRALSRCYCTLSGGFLVEGCRVSLRGNWQETQYEGSSRPRGNTTSIVMNSDADSRSSSPLPRLEN